MTTTTLNANLTNTAVRSCLPTEASLDQCVAHFAIASYAVEGNLREMARATSKYIVQGAGPETLELHANTKKLVRAAGLKYNLKYGVGYPHSDGTLHYFAGRRPVMTEKDKDIMACPYFDAVTMCGECCCDPCPHDMG